MEPFSRSRHAAWSAFVTALLAVFWSLASAPAAQAQAVDWLVNVGDTGFDPIAAGGTIDYAVSIGNNGSGTAPATTVDFAIPAGAELSGISGGLTGCRIGATPISPPVAGAATVTCDVPSLPSSGQIDATVSILTDSSGVIALTATVPTAGDGLPGNNTSTEQTTVTAGADLGISLSLPPTAASGSRIPLNVTVTNNGPNDATGFDINFPIPTGITNITGLGGGPLPAGCSVGGGSINCTINSTLDDTLSLVRSFEGQVSAAGGSTVTGSASVLNAAPGDPIATNNTDTQDILIEGGTDLAIDISQSPGGSLLVGDTTEFLIQSSYTGDSPNDLTVTTTIPSNYTITDITSPDGWDCEVAPGTQDVTCTLPSGSGAGADIDLGDIVIETEVVAAGAPAVTATIAAASPNETILSNNSDTVAATIIEPTVDLSARKAGIFPPQVVVGQVNRYTLSAENQGTANFIGTVVLTDNLPTGVTVTRYPSNNWTCLPAAPVVGGPGVVITCTRVYTAAAPLAPGERTPNAVLQFVATQAGTISNSMTVSSPDANIPDNNPTNDTVTFDIGSEEETDSADVSALKTASLPSVAAGEIQTFAIEMVNTGPSTAVDVRMNDTIRDLINNSVGPTGAGYVGESIAPGVAVGLACTNNAAGPTARRLLCNMTELPVCTPGSDCPVVTVQVRPGGDAGTRTNSARVRSFDTPDSNRSNDTNEVDYDVEARYDLTVAKTVNPNPANAGQPVTFVITATNVENGLSAAEDVTIRETLPDDMTFVSASPATGSCSGVPAAGTVTSGDTFTCNLGTIPNGAQRTVTVVARPNNALIGTTVTNEASVFRAGFETTPDPLETDLTNNDTTVDFDVIDAELDILVNKDDSVDPVVLGETTVYTLTVTNAGPSASQNIVVTDILPDAVFAYRSHSAPGGTCTTVPVVAPTPPADPAQRTLECTYPVLEAGDSVIIEITAEAVSKGNITNNVSISSDEIVAGTDALSGNNQTSETTTSRTRADPEVTSKVADTDPVNLREPFNFVVTVTNNTGPMLAEADDVFVTDTLPAGMFLTGPPTVTSGAASVTSTSCTGAAGGSSFSCDLGTFASGGVVQITVPVRVEDIGAGGGTLTNSAEITTSSFDDDPTNNENSGDVTVVVSSLAGTVYRDFNDSATPTVPGQDLPLDTGVSGVTMTLTGTAFDSSSVSETVVTDVDGNYLFPVLPEGTYVVTRGAVADPDLSDGQNTVGSEGGTLPSQTVISAISLPADTDATDYDFAVIPVSAVPLSRIGIAKDVVGAITTNADGSFDTTFRLLVENFSDEALINVEVTDELQGTAPLFGTNVAATDGTPGQYAIIAPPSGTCGGLDAGFTGVGDDVVASGFSLAIGATCTIDFSVRTQPTDPLPPVLASGGRYENQAIVTGTGADTGQTPLTNPNLTDLSDNGSEPDTNNDGDGSDANENDPTPVNPSLAPGISLIKTASDPGPTPQVGDTITYSFEVENTGNVTLTNVTIADTLPGINLTGGPITLTPGQIDTGTFSATYQLLDTDIAAGSLVNLATVTGTPPSGDDVTDGSSVTTPLPQVPGIETTKTVTLADNGDGIEGVGDTLEYTITVENTGNVPLSGLGLVDTLTDLNAAVLTLDSGPDFDIASLGSPEGSLEPGEIATYLATYVAEPGAVTSGGVDNTVTATGTPDFGPVPSVSDVSDDGIDSDGNTVDDPTEYRFIISAAPPTSDITLNKTTTAGVVRRGDIVPYTLTVENTGVLAAGPFDLVDTLPPGFLYVPGSSSLAGAVVSGRRITWPGVVVPPAGTLTVTLTARILNGARAGELVNTVELLDPLSGAPVVPPATAAVRLLPEAVFECGDVIGKVYHDVNGNGRQDPDAPSSISDQNIFSSKVSPAVSPDSFAEDGIANARLATVDGTIITTDEFGRFSVPCAMLPANGGSNFILKLDERSLPAGYRVTTENPRVMRLTPGMMSEMNFGVALGRVARIDLGPAAFPGGEMSPQLIAGIQRLLPQLANEIATLRLAYMVRAMADESEVATARQALRMVERYIRQEWRDIGDQRLLIEQIIRRMGQ